MDVAVCGPRGYGSFRLRGNPLHNHYGWDMLHCHVPLERSYDTVYLVKRRLRRDLPENLSQNCRRLIFDPLDFWSSPARLSTSIPVAWIGLWDRYRFHDIVATSPACYRTMRESLAPRGVRVHLVPHHCDKRIKPDWYNPDGPIVYAGDRCYIGRYIDQIKHACDKIQREFLLAHGQHHSGLRLEGASLALCLRLPPHDSEFNRYCKPQIKLENAAAARLPVAYNGHPCEMSLRPNGHVIKPENLTTSRLATELLLALQAERFDNPFTEQQYVESIKKIVETEDEVNDWHDSL